MSLLLRGIHAAGYRSLRSVRFPVGRLSVFVGANGVGKTNLYRALAVEGGTESALWAGERRRKEPVRITLKAVFGESADGTQTHSYKVSAGITYSYETEIGLRLPTAAAFAFEPQIKEETFVHHYRGRAQKILERRGPTAFARGVDGERAPLGGELLASETALSSIEDVARYPDIYAVRQTMLDWRFYHEMRTDRDAPLRQPCLAIASPTLASDGANLGAVFATLTYYPRRSSGTRPGNRRRVPGRRLGRAATGPHRRLRHDVL